MQSQRNERRYDCSSTNETYWSGKEVAEVAAFLAGQEYLTGQTIAIDGGMTMQ